MASSGWRYSAADVERLRRDISFTETPLGQPMTFDTTWGLFSPKAIDAGSRLLLDQLELAPDEHTLDLGCGYGAIGLPIARATPAGRALLVDKDFVAVEYARRNARRNGLDNVEVRLSNGLDQVGDADFSLAVSNLPAKTGKEHYYLFFHDIRQHLRPGGRCYVVVISGLRRFVERAFNEVFGNYRKVKQGRDYTVARAEVR